MTFERFQENISLKKPVVCRNIYIDFLRGLAILGVLVFHFAFDLASIDFFFANFVEIVDSGNVKWILRMYHFMNVTLYNDTMTIVVILFASLFCFLSGLVSYYSRHTLRNGFKLALIAIIISLVSYLASLITKSAFLFIRFGIVHLMAFSHIVIGLLDLLFHRLDKHIKGPLFVYLGLLIVFISIFLYYFDPYVESNNPFVRYLLEALGFIKGGQDHYAIIPFAGVLFLGTGIGRLLDRNLNRALKPVKQENRLVSTFVYLGRNSLVFYVCHQLVYVPLIILFFSFFGFRVF